MSRLLVLVVLLALAACGPAASDPPAEAPRAGPSTGTPSEMPTETPTATSTGGPDNGAGDLEAPPPFGVRYAGRELVLRPHTWCYANGCVDGWEETPTDVGRPRLLRVRVPVDDWDLSVTFTPHGERCGRQHTVTPERGDDGWLVLRPVGHPADYDLDLFASGRGGDMAARLRWTTTTAGEMPTPSAELALIADNDGEPDSYGVELSVVNLATTPRRASVAITVTAANGRSSVLRPRRSREACWPEGSAFFRGSDERGRAAAALGDFPFTYEVVLRLDGETYRASATYPDDEIPDYGPYVGLELEPALPAPR